MSTDQRVDPEPLSADEATYHGSLTELHGPCVVLGDCLCPDCDTEMVCYLAGPDVLEHLTGGGQVQPQPPVGELVGVGPGEVAHHLGVAVRAHAVAQHDARSVQPGQRAVVGGLVSGQRLGVDALIGAHAGTPVTVVVLVVSSVWAARIRAGAAR